MNLGRKIISLAALLGVGLIATACGGSSTSNTAASATPYGRAASSPANGVSVGTTKGSLGTYLVGPSGRAVYIWVADKGGKSSCNGACASAWPPLLTKSTPTAAAGVEASLLSTTTRSDGSMQVTYKGWPLYYFAGDTGAGTTSGNGSNQFGAKWWLINPSGGSVGATASAKSTPATSSSASSASGSSSGSSWG